MTESEWMASDDPQAMLRLRRTACCGCWWTDNGDGTVSLAAGARPCGQCDNGPILPLSPFSDRKLRLFILAAALAARGERYQGGSYQRIGLTDGQQHEGEDTALQFAERWCDPKMDTPGDPPMCVRAALLREIVGNPFKPVTLPESITGEPTVLMLAAAAYEQRGQKCDDPICRGRGRWADAAGDMDDCQKCGGTGTLDDGTLDGSRLAVLSDALEEAGCDSVELLAHLRSPGPHVRGCWVVDLLSGKE